MRVPARAWKWLGVAGLTGVAATGALVARDQRQRRQMAPEEIRARLHHRVADLDRSADEGPGRSGGSSPSEHRP